jgi:hypothetical protein
LTSLIFAEVLVGQRLLCNVALTFSDREVFLALNGLRYFASNSVIAELFVSLGVYICFSLILLETMKILLGAEASGHLHHHAWQFFSN